MKLIFAAILLAGIASSALAQGEHYVRRGGLHASALHARTVAEGGLKLRSLLYKWQLRCAARQ